MCNCIIMTEAMILGKHGMDGQIVNVELLSGRTYSTFQYKDGKKNKTQMILHSYCPFCGQKYQKKAEGNKG